MDKKDRGEESEDEIWEGPSEAPTATVSTPTRTPNKVTPLKNVKVDNVGNGAAAANACDDEDYGGSTEVDEQDTDDEIEM